jgi:hypothetical protein
MSSNIVLLGRMDVEALLGDLLDQGEPLLAARLLLFFVEGKLKGDLIQGSFFKERLIAKIIRSATLPPYYNPSDPNGPTRLHPRGRADIDVILPLMNALAKTRHAREERSYKYLLERLCAEGLYDTAAKVYVELVEEWVTEGRVAQGADLESFYEGGGPPRKGKEEWELRSNLYKTWWKGIRTWALPGEVLSPHDRLDLWHPRKLKLPERLRRFPYPVPSSPPSVAPHPTLQNLAIILDHLELDPDATGLEPFQRSMRACAILSSTILSRTLPYLPSRLLREVLLQTPYDPPVYPEGFQVPENGSDDWAYTAYTHIHLAIRSVLLSPPTAPSLFKYMVAYDEAKTTGSPLPELPEQYRYRTAPLNFASCVCLVVYGLRKLQNADSVRYIVKYAQEAWGASRLPYLYNVLLRGTSVVKEDTVAAQTEGILFGDTQIGRDAPPLSPVRAPRRQETLRSDTFWQELDKSVGVVPTDRSLHAALLHMISSNQRDRFLDTVYRLIPFMQYSRKVLVGDLPDDEQYLAADPLSDSKRPPPTPLTPILYSTVLHGLRLMEATATARRVYALALQAERLWQEGYEAGTEIPDEHRLNIDTFTEMMQVWNQEARTLQRPQHRNTTALELDPYMRRGSHSRHELYTKAEAAEQGVWDVYWAARNRYRAALETAGYNIDRVGSIRPSYAFFNALLVARAEAWGIRKGDDWSVGLTAGADPLAFADREDQPKAIREMRIFASDLKAWQMTGSHAVNIRLGLRKPVEVEEVARWSQHRRIRASKAGMLRMPENDWLLRTSKMTKEFDDEVKLSMEANDGKSAPGQEAPGKEERMERGIYVKEAMVE